MIREECLKVVQAMWKYKDCGYLEYEIREVLGGKINEMGNILLRFIKK